MPKPLDTFINLLSSPHPMSQLTPEQQKELQEKLKKMSPEELLEFQKQQCIFCQIVAGKIPAKKILETEKCLAILDINPATKGHILLLPKDHVAIMPQLHDSELAPLFATAQHLSQLLLRALRVDGTSLFIANGLAAGQRSQHFLLHLIPRKEGDGLLPMSEKLLSHDDLSKTKAAIQYRLNQILGLSKPEPPKKAEPKIEKIESKKTVPKAKKTEAQKTEPKQKTGEKVSLDDIANLFK